MAINSYDNIKLNYSELYNNLMQTISAMQFSFNKNSPSISNRIKTINNIRYFNISTNKYNNESVLIPNIYDLLDNIYGNLQDSIFTYNKYSKSGLNSGSDTILVGYNNNSIDRIAFRGNSIIYGLKNSDDESSEYLSIWFGTEKNKIGLFQIDYNYTVLSEYNGYDYFNNSNYFNESISIKNLNKNISQSIDLTPNNEYIPQGIFAGIAPVFVHGIYFKPYDLESYYIKFINNELVEKTKSLNLKLFDDYNNINTIKINKNAININNVSIFDINNLRLKNINIYGIDLYNSDVTNCNFISNRFKFLRFYSYGISNTLTIGQSTKDLNRPNIYFGGNNDSSYFNNYFLGFDDSVSQSYFSAQTFNLSNLYNLKYDSYTGYLTGYFQTCSFYNESSENLFNTSHIKFYNSTYESVYSTLLYHYSNISRTTSNSNINTSTDIYNNSSLIFNSSLIDISSDTSFIIKYEENNSINELNPRDLLLNLYKSCKIMFLQPLDNSSYSKSTDFEVKILANDILNKINYIRIYLNGAITTESPSLSSNSLYYTLVLNIDTIGSYKLKAIAYDNNDLELSNDVINITIS